MPSERNFKFQIKFRLQSNLNSGEKVSRDQDFPDENRELNEESKRKVSWLINRKNIFSLQSNLEILSKTLKLCETLFRHVTESE